MTPCVKFHICAPFILRPGQNGHDFADDIFKRFVEPKIYKLIQISLNYNHAQLIINHHRSR